MTASRTIVSYPSSLAVSDLLCSILAHLPPTDASLRPSFLEDPPTLPTAGAARPQEAKS